MSLGSKISGIAKGKNSSMILRVLIMLVVFAAFTIINPSFASAYNLKNLFTDVVTYLVMGLGIAFVLIIGSIDLSTGAICSTSTVIVAVLIPIMGGASYLVAIAMGLIAGLLNGFIVVYLKVPSFIATLGSMGIWQTVAYIASGSRSIQILRDDWIYINWAKVSVGVFSLAFILVIIFAVILYIVQTKTKYGKSCFAIGVNERAAMTAGVNVNGTKMIVFILCGLCAALSGIVMAANLRSGLPTGGLNMNMYTITAVLLGGTSLSGGKGGMINTVIGCLIYIMLKNGLNVIGITSYTQEIILGILLIVAIFFTVDRKDRHTVVK